MNSLKTEFSQERKKINMKKFAGVLLNSIFFITVIILAFAVATIALTKKVNEYSHKYNQSIKGTIIKQVIPVLSSGKGIVKEMRVKTGQKVKKDDLLIELDNPVLERKIEVLKEFTNNESAQTEAKVAEEELGNLKIIAPTDGIIGDIAVTQGMSVDSLSRILTFYSNENIRLLAQLDISEYQTIKRLHQVGAYSERLNQSFYIVPDILSPEVMTPETKIEDKKIGLFFNFQNRTDAVSLLNNEDLTLQLNTPSEKVNKPIDYFVNFWNQLLAK